MSEMHKDDKEFAAGTFASVAEEIREGSGFWKSCSGCHEANEGYETGHYPYITAFQCHQGGGCHECGGLGMVWDDTDYADMARSILEDDRREEAALRPAPSSEGIEKPVGTEVSSAWFFVEEVFRAFSEDLRLGYSTKDKRFVVDLLGKALEQRQTQAALSHPEQQGGGAVLEQAAQIAQEALKCRNCGYVGPWKECCGNMNFDGATPSEVAQAIRALTLVSDPKDLEAELRERIAELEAENESLREHASELADLMDDVVAGSYNPDGFTTRPARTFLARLDKKGAEE